MMMMMKSIPDSIHTSMRLPHLIPHLKAQTPRKVFPLLLLLLSLCLSLFPCLSPFTTNLILSFPSQDKYPQVQRAKCHSIRMPCTLREWHQRERGLIQVQAGSSGITDP